MRPDHIFSIAVIASAIAGLMPLGWLPFAAFSWLWMPSWLPYERGIVVFLSMLIASTTVLVASGVPAALYERIVGDPTGRAALWIWAASATLIALLLAGAMVGGAR